jgi:hypothetical protein
MFAPPRPNVRPADNRPRRAKGHSELTFCSCVCAVCDERMKARSLSVKAGEIAEGFAPKGTRRWYEARDAYLTAQR